MEWDHTATEVLCKLSPLRWWWRESVHLAEKQDRQQGEETSRKGSLHHPQACPSESQFPVLVVVPQVGLWSFPAESSLCSSEAVRELRPSLRGTSGWGLLLFVALLRLPLRPSHFSSRRAPPRLRKEVCV